MNFVNTLNRFLEAKKDRVKELEQEVAHLEHLLETTRNGLRESVDDRNKKSEEIRKIYKSLRGDEDWPDYDASHLSVAEWAASLRFEVDQLREHLKYEAQRNDAEVLRVQDENTRYAKLVDSQAKQIEGLTEERDQWMEYAKSGEARLSDTLRQLESSQQHVKGLEAEVARLAKELAMWKPMTPEEADKAYDEAPAEPMSEEEIERMVQAAVKGELE